MVNHIAEICAELVRYRVFILIDEILDHHTTDLARKEIEVALWQLLQTLETSKHLTIAAR
jgi:hypothetical protein